MRQECFRFVVVKLTLLVMLLSLPVILIGQDATGKIEGVLKDPQGAVVTTGTITAIHSSTGLERLTHPDHDGRFVFNLLPIGSYKITVDVDKFSKIVREPVTVQVNDSISLVFDLKLGSTQDTLEIKSDAPQVDVVSNTIGKVTTQREILDLPLNGRNFAQLGLLQPGAAPLTLGLAQGGGALRAGQMYAINGLRPESNNFLIDGGRNMNNVDSGFALRPPIDSIAEFRIITGGVPAEFGDAIASVTNLVSRSGTNSLHGSLYEFFRNDVFDARNFYSEDVPPLKQNQFGGTIGGPIRKNRTFFFGYYEGFYNREGLTRTTTVPTALEKQGDFSQSVDSSGQVPPLINYLFGQPYPGNKLPPGSTNPVSQNLLNFFPAGNLTPNIYSSTLVDKNNNNQFGVRIDHQFRDTDQMFGRYLFSQGSANVPLSIAGANVPGFPIGNDLRTQSFLLAETHSFTPLLLNFARFAYFRNRFNFDQHLNQMPPSSVGFNLTPTFPEATGIPFIQTAGFASIGDPISGPRLTTQNSYEFSDSLSWIHNRHNLKFGGEYRFNSVDAINGIASNGFYVMAGFPVSNPFANFLLGAPVFFLQAGGELPRGLSNNDISFYAQDEFKVNSRFTINAGLRYQINTPIKDVNDRMAGWEPGVQSIVMPSAPTNLVYPGDPGVSRGLIPTYWKGVSPRFGMAWDPTGSGNTTVRASYGVFFESVALGQGGILQAPISAPPYLQTPQVTNIFLSAFGIPAPTFQDPWQGNPNPFPPGQFSPSLTHLTLESNLRPPYVQNWNLVVQRLFAQNYVLEVRYMGTKGTRLPRFIEGNPAIYNPDGPNNPNIDRRRIYAGCETPAGPCDFSSIGLISGSTNSTYHAFQVNLNRRFANGLYFNAAYTLSKTLDYVSSFNETGSSPTNIVGENDLPQNPFDWRAEHGPSIFDARNRFVLSASWEIPLSKSASKGVRLVFGNWQLNGIASFSSATPFTVYDSTDVSQQGSAPEITGFSSNRPNLVSNPNIGPRTPDHWFNTQAFQKLDPVLNAGQFGNAGRNVVRGDGYKTVDLSLVKTFTFKESRQIQFRAESFNIANHPNFFAPANDIESPNFGRMMQAASPRVLQFALKLMF